MPFCKNSFALNSQLKITFVQRSKRVEKMDTRLPFLASTSIKHQNEEKTMKTSLVKPFWYLIIGMMIVLFAIPATAATMESLAARVNNSMKGKKVVHIAPAMVFELARAWEYAIRKEAQALGMEYELVDANMDPNLLLQGVRAQINKRPDFLIVHNLSMQQLTRVLKKAEKKGIHVIQISLNSRYISDASVGPDWFELGRSMAEDIVKECGKGSGKSGKVAIVSGSMSAPDTVIYNKVSEAVFKQHPEIKVVSNQANNWDGAQSRSITATVLQQHPDLCATWGHYGVHQIAAGQAVREAGLQDKVLVYSTGAATMTMHDALKGGLIDKYWAYNSMQQGHDIMSALKIIAQRGKKAGQDKLALFTVITVLTKENYQEHPHVFFTVPKH